MLDVRVKERLTGAIILVALLVLLVPELLTGRGHSASSGQAPANGDGGQTRSYTIDLADGSASKPVTAPSETPASHSPDAQTNATSGTESDAATSPSSSASGSASAPPESDATASAAPAPSAEPEKPVPAPRPGDKARADASKVAPLASRGEVSAQAPSPPRNEATPRADLAKSTPAARSANEASARASAPEARLASGWAVQVGSFASRENAERLTRELKGKGFAATVSESTGKGKRLWRVRVGPEADRAAAVAVGAKLRSAGHSGGAVVPYP
jgi:DedD protein